MEQVTSSDELVLCCVDRARNDSHAVLSLPGETTANRGFIGKGEEFIIACLATCSYSAFL